MKQRCSCPTANNYRLYGARGITVCERWRTSFQHFVDDMGPRPTPKHSIDRYPDKDGNYEPSNCRWATPKEQRHNRHVQFAHMAENEKAAAKRRMLEAAQRSNDRYRNAPKICRQCGGEYTHRQGYTDSKKAPKFCSRECYGASLKRPDRTCQFCGTTFHPKRRVETAKYCSLLHAIRGRELARRE